MDKCRPRSVGFFFRSQLIWDLHCLQRQGISGISRTRVKSDSAQTYLVSISGLLLQSLVLLLLYVCISISAQTCNVVVSVNGLTKTASNSYTYDGGLTPTISGVSPSRGGTGGGTTVTISGSGFG